MKELQNTTGKKTVVNFWLLKYCSIVIPFIGVQVIACMNPWQSMTIKWWPRRSSRFEIVSTRKMLFYSYHRGRELLWEASYNWANCFTGRSAWVLHPYPWWQTSNDITQEMQQIKSFCELTYSLRTLALSREALLSKHFEEIQSF